MEENLISDSSLLEDMFQPLLIALKTSNPEKALETLIETSRAESGRQILANEKTVLSALRVCQKLSYNPSSNILSLTLKLLRNLCAGEIMNQDLFLSHGGVEIILTTLDKIEISNSNFGVIRIAIQVLANVSLAGDVHKAEIWSKFFPDKFHELASVRTREICDPLCMIIYTCCNGNNRIFGELLGDRGLPLMDEIVRTASTVGVGEDWLEWLLSKICFEMDYFPELFLRFFASNVAGDRQVANFSGSVLGDEQSFLSYIISNLQLHEISIPVKFALGILEILKQSLETAKLLPQQKSSVDVLAYSLTILRDICANTKESMNLVIDSLLSAGFIEMLLSMLGELEPPEMIKKAMKQNEDKEETRSVPLKKPCLYKGYRRDVVSVIANLAFGRKRVQDEVRERKGIPLLLQHCVSDGDNPFLREWGIWAMRNLLEGNLENQQVVAELELQGSVDVPEIADLGMKVEVDPITRRVKLVNTS